MLPLSITIATAVNWNCSVLQLRGWFYRFIGCYVTGDVKARHVVELPESLTQELAGALSFFT